MKITFVLKECVSLTGGVRVVAIYADLLRRRNHDVQVVALSLPKPSYIRQIKSLIKGEGIIKKPVGKSIHLEHRNVEYRIYDHAAPITDDDVPDGDVIIATWWETAEWVAALSPSKGRKFYFVQGYEAFGNSPAERVEQTYSLPLKKITVSNWLVRKLADYDNTNDILLVPNSVDHKDFDASPRAKQSVPTFGFVYSSRQIKGSDIALEAIRKASARLPQIKLICFGTELPSSKLPLPNDAKFFYKPEQDFLKRIYARCDAWLFTSRLDGFGLPILEAMACRTPVVAVNMGAAEELLASGGGILTKMGDVEDVANAIETIGRMPDGQWREMSMRAYCQASQYSWDDATVKFERIIGGSDA